MLYALAPLVAALPAALPLHDGDLKILDARPPVQAPVFRRSAASPDELNLMATAFDSKGVRLEAWFPLASLDGANSANDCWGYVSPSGREYAIIATSSGTNYIDISNPTNPFLVESIAGPSSFWRDVKVYDTYAYSVSEGGGGIQIIDLSDIDNGAVTLAGAVSDTGPNRTHNVAVDTDSGFLYRTGGSFNGLAVYSLADPANPTFVSVWSNRYVHDAQVVTYTEGPFAGRQIAFCCVPSPNELEIVDVTDKQNIVSLARVPYPNSGYSHQGWLSVDRQYFYLGDESDEDGSDFTRTFTFDVSDIENPFYVGSFTADAKATSHNMETRGRSLFQANYRSGLRVLGLANPTQGEEYAYFDVDPNSDSLGFSGLWGVHTDLPSGTIIGSDTSRGLFLLRLTGVGFYFPQGDLEFVQDVETRAPFELLGDFVASTVQLKYDVGQGEQTVPLPPRSDGSYEFILPPLSCGTTLLWSIEVENSLGETIKYPESGPSTELIGDVATLLQDDCESPFGWTVGAPEDDATYGTWTNGENFPTSVSPNSDNSPGPGNRCWFTGVNPSITPAAGDVDDGQVTLITPSYALSAQEDPIVSFYLWYYNQGGFNPGEDVFQVDLSNDGGASWTSVLTVGPDGEGTSGDWIPYSITVKDFFPTPSDQVQLRFVASDLGGTSIVEAAIDDISITSVICDPCSATNYCEASPNSTGQGAQISASGSLVVAENELVLTTTGLPPNAFGLYFYGPESAQVAFGNGIRCVGGGFFRLGIVAGDAAGTASYPVDLTAPPEPAGQVLPGSTWNYQFWYRDTAAGGALFNLTNGLRVEFCP